MPESGGIYYIINKKSGLASDLSAEDREGKTFVVGLPFEEKETQKWEFVRAGDGSHWTIRNISNGKFYNIDIPANIPGAIREGVRVVTTNTSREWVLSYGDGPDTFRIFIPASPLNTGEPLGNNRPVGVDITLQIELPEENQIWDIKDAQ